jgi:hypothetical protein
MKRTLLALLTCATLTANAQLAQPAPDPKPVDLHLAGSHIEKAGKQRNTAMFVGLGMAALGGMVMSVDSDNAAPGIGLAVMGLGIGIGINLGANGHERKAGRILQGR